MIFHAKMWLTEGDLSPHDVGFKLNQIPMSALGKPRGYQQHARGNAEALLQIREEYGLKISFT